MPCFVYCVSTMCHNNLQTMIGFRQLCTYLLFIAFLESIPDISLSWLDYNWSCQRDWVMVNQGHVQGAELICFSCKASLTFVCRQRTNYRINNKENEKHAFKIQIRHNSFLKTESNVCLWLYIVWHWKCYSFKTRT